MAELEGGERVRNDKVLIATGSRNRRFPIPGLDLEGVYDLRTDGLRGDSRPAINGGFFGLLCARVVIAALDDRD